ncbi:MAG: hypothetical protein PUG31_05640 [Eubacteriales bacterium]|jgi:hypothetical protein|nr:hypothetical protein [Clostridiales bacterium]MDD7396885.1 hypothetical protein [Eubacteriales bacterium]MDY2982012.1 hypothetical protein [Eubacteriales bacterium]
MEIALINRHNFTRESLDAFSRYQVVKNVYRVKEGEMYLAYRPFVETWTLERKREKAAEILAGDHIVYGAFEKNGDIVGIMLLLPVLEHDRMILDSFHVSTHKRRQGHWPGAVRSGKGRGDPVWSKSPVCIGLFCPGDD